MSVVHPPIFIVTEPNGKKHLFFPDGTPVSKDYALELLTGIEEVAKLLGVKVNYRLKWLIDALPKEIRKEAEQYMRRDIR